MESLERRTTILMTIFYFAYNSNDPLPPLPKIDAREMPNQYRNRSDKEELIAVQQHPLFEGLVKNTIKLHKLWGNIAVGCQFGKHRSQAIAKAAAHKINKKAKQWTPSSLD